MEGKPLVRQKKTLTNMNNSNIYIKLIKKYFFLLSASGLE